MINDELINEINKNIPVVLPVELSLDELQVQLASYINQLIQNSFQKLISLLYRIDVSETKLKQLLQQYPGEDAGKIIAGMIIERQLEKINSRRQFKQPDDNFTEEEKW